MLNLDTHVLLFALDDGLTARERRLLQNTSWGISAIVLWEIAKLSQLGRIGCGLDDPALRKVLDFVHIWPLDTAVCARSTQLDFRSDPADELIAATSLVYAVPLLTRARRIRASRIIPLA